MFDLMQYALIFYDFQLILAQMGVNPPRTSRLDSDGAGRHHAPLRQYDGARGYLYYERPV